MILNNIEAIIFDLDGTLWNATEIELKAINDVIEKYYGISKITIEQLQNVMGIPLQEAATILFTKPKKELGIEILNKSGYLLDNYIENCKIDLLYDTVRETIKNLKKQYKLCIVSNCKKGYIETFLKTQKLAGIFTDYECNGNTGLSKGENIKLIIKRNNIKSAVYVGDTISDKNASKFAKIPFIYASYGFGNVEEFDYKLKIFEELKNIYL